MLGPAEQQSEDRAVRTAQALAGKHAGVIVWSRRPQSQCRLVWVHLQGGTTAGEVLIREGYAVRWTPGYRDSWCWQLAPNRKNAKHCFNHCATLICYCGSR